MITSQWRKSGGNKRTGRRKLEELELVLVKIEDKKLGKRKKNTKPGPQMSFFSLWKKRLSASQKTGVCGSPHHRVWVYL